MRNKKIFVFVFIIVLVTLSTSMVFADSWGGAGNTTRIGDTQIKFNTDYDQRMGYGYNGFIFVKNYYESQYGIYSPVKSGDVQPFLTMRRYLRENTQTTLGSGGEHLVGATWWSAQSGQPDYNLKKGSSDPSKWGPTAYNGDNTGTFRMSNYNPVKFYEFRYIGYTRDGVVIENPYFPSDNSGGVSPELKNWQTFTQMNSSYPSLRHVVTDYNDDMNNDKAKRTFEAWFNSTEIGAKFKAKALQNGARQGEEWKYWNQRMAILTDIDDGAGLIKGWHIVNGRLWYQTFAIPKPPENNITLTKFELIDPDTGQVVMAHTRELDETDVMNVSKQNVYYTNFGAVIEKGKTYKLKVEYFYNSKAKDANALPRPTQTGSIVVDRHYAYDENTNKYNTFNEEYMMANGKGLTSFDKPVVLQPGEKAHFELDYIIPDSVKSSGSLYVKVPPIYTEKSDDLVIIDNWLNLTFSVAQNDIGFTQPVELLNSVGSKVNFVKPNESHKVRFNVKHFLGKVAIGLDTVRNPKTTIDVEIRDGNNNIVKQTTIKTNEILNPNSQITIDVPNVSTPTTMLKACAKINPIHKEKGLNSNPQNDTICEVFSQAKNYAIKELKINPHYINIPDGTSTTTQNLNFRFVVAHEGEDGRGNTPTVVVRQGGREIKRATVLVRAGTETTVVWSIPANLRFGNNDFEVEVNPAPRTIQEFRSVGLDPYADNIKKDTVVVRRNPECIDCDKGVRTRNTWSEIFEIREWTGHLEWFSRCVSRDENGRCDDWDDYQACVIDWESEWTEIKNYYEEYKITNIYFRSKWSKDTQGGDGWIDLLKTQGKIKAGYGFELKIVTNYDTNRGSNVPSPPWGSGCSGRSVSP